MGPHHHAARRGTAASHRKDTEATPFEVAPRSHARQSGAADTPRVAAPTPAEASRPSAPGRLLTRPRPARARTGPTETFANPVLCPPQDLAGEPDVETERFEIAHLEVWGVDPTALRHADAAASGDAADRLPGGPHLHPSIRRTPP